MKILMIGWGFPPRIEGGLDTHVYEICRGLARRNEVFLALPEFNSPGKSLARRSDDISPSRHSRSGIRIIPIKCALRKSLAGTVREYNRNLLKACGGLDFDVVHSHDWFGVEAAEALREGTGRPWVFTLHSLERMRSCGHGKRSVMERLERKGAQGCDRIIAVSRFMKGSIVGSCGVGPEKIEVVYNSARFRKGDPARIRKRLGLGDRPVALFLGRLSQQKGVEYLIYSAKSALEEVPEARFVIAGDGHLKASLQSFSRSLGLGGKVLFPGFVPEQELASYYSAADVFVSPSLYEPFGITVLESLYAGTPVIAGEGAGVFENLPRMGCLQAVRPGDSRELSEKMASFLRRRVRVSGREMAAIRKAYSWEKSVKELQRIYQTLI